MTFLVLDLKYAADVLVQLGAVIDAQGVAENLVLEKPSPATSLVSDASASSHSLTNKSVLANCMNSIVLDSSSPRM